MTHSESDVLNVKALMLLQSSKPEATHMLRTMLIDAIFNKYGNKRQTKPIPPIWRSSSSETVKSESKKSESKSSPEGYDSTDSDSGGSENALEILEGSLTTCSVCNGEKSSRNLVECSECHLLYHKECHSPPITEDLSDPRVVWYCRNCNKQISKPKAEQSNKPTSRSSSSSVKSSSSSKTFGGTRSKSSSSSSSKSHVPNINIISADKRIQIMKKKAARKIDKRTTK